MPDGASPLQIVIVCVVLALAVWGLVYSMVDLVRDLMEENR